jgi:hypothetical protein
VVEGFDITHEIAKHRQVAIQLVSHHWSIASERLTQDNISTFAMTRHHKQCGSHSRPL